MNKEFVASNGIRIRQGQRGYYEYMVKNGTGFSENGRCVQGSLLDLAIGEYYRAREDERLGRWRWPESPDYVVYRPVDMTHYVRVLRESGGVVEVMYRDGLEGRESPAARAARAYFDAHPEPKPWQDAKPGEVWVITFSESGGGTTEPWTMSKHGLFENPNYVSSIRVKDLTIISARKIWPQDEPAIDDLSYDA